MKIAMISAIAALALVPNAAMAGSPVAPQSAGTLVSASTGTLVIRDGKAMPAVAGQQLLANDRVITRNGAKAVFSSKACKVSLKPGSIYTPSAGCSSKSFALAQGDEGSAGDAGEGGVSPWIIGGLAVAAIAGGVVAGVSGGGSPASP